MAAAGLGPASKTPAVIRNQPQRVDNPYRIAIVGQGFVGRAIARDLQDRCDVVSWDRSDGTPYPKAEIDSSDLVMICVDTPPDDRTGACDISNVEDAVRRVNGPLTLIKSTVAPGTTDQLTRDLGRPLCHSPEFFGEGRHSSADWGSDRSQVKFSIVGGPPGQRAGVVSILTTLHGPQHRFHVCTALDAELIKYMENSYLATKVSFVNEWYEIVQQFGGDWTAVREGWLLDPRVGRSHSAIFLHDRGFGGKCLPKDLRALIAACHDKGLDPRLLCEVMAFNDDLRSRHTIERELPSSI